MQLIPNRNVDVTSVKTKQTKSPTTSAKLIQAQAANHPRSHNISKSSDKSFQFTHAAPGILQYIQEPQTENRRPHPRISSSSVSQNKNHSSNRTEHSTNQKATYAWWKPSIEDDPETKKPSQIQSTATQVKSSIFNDNFDATRPRSRRGCRHGRSGETMARRLRRRRRRRRARGGKDQCVMARRGEERDGSWMGIGVRYESERTDRPEFWTGKTGRGRNRNTKRGFLSEEVWDRCPNTLRVSYVISQNSWSVIKITALVDCVNITENLNWSNYDKFILI